MNNNQQDMIQTTGSGGVGSGVGGVGGGRGSALVAAIRGDRLPNTTKLKQKNQVLASLNFGKVIYDGVKFSSRQILNKPNLNAYFSEEVLEELEPLFCYVGDYSQILVHADYRESLILAYKIPTYSSWRISFLIIPTFSKQPILLDKKTNYAILKKEIKPEGLEYLQYALKFAKMVQEKVLEESE